MGHQHGAHLLPPHAPRQKRRASGGSSQSRIPVQLPDLPQFTIVETALTQGSWVLTGHFNHLTGVEEGRSWLYVSRADSLIGELFNLERESRTARFDTYDHTRPAAAVEGHTLPWFEGTWHDAAHVAVVLDRTHLWQSVRFEATDALARRDGEWRRLRSAAGAQPEADEVLVPGGWDHEQCWFCTRDIRPGRMAVTDAEGHWACAPCHASYVQKQDLGFLYAAT
jgi:hypothetical protein